MATYSIEASANSLIRVSGTVDTSTVIKVRAQGEKLIDGCPERFVVDLAGLDSAHSVILSLLMRWISHARKQGKQFHIENFPSKLFDVARVSGLETLLPLDDTADA